MSRPILKKPRPMSKKLKTSQKKLGQTPPQSKKLEIAWTLYSKSLGLCQNVLDKSIPHARSPCPRRRNHLDHMEMPRQRLRKILMKPMKNLRNPNVGLINLLKSSSIL